MKANKFAELLSLATAIKTTVDFQAAQLQNFSAQCQAACAETKQALSSINDSVKALSITPPPLTAAQTESLHNLQRTVAQHLKALNRDFAKPIAEFAKHFNKQEQKLNDRIIKSINAETEPSAFDLNQIRTIVASIKPVISASKDLIATCNFVVNACLAQGFELEAKIERIDMPQHMQQTAKTIQQLTADLAQLNMHLGTLPAARQEYKVDFLPLSKALRGLSLQSMALLAEEQVTNVTPAEEEEKLLKLHLG